MQRAAAVLCAIDRAAFAPGVALEEVYAHAALALSHTMMSAPSAHARACAALGTAVARPAARVLDIGAGSGYMTACLAQLAAMGGQGHAALIVALERTQEVADKAANAARAVANQGGHSSVALSIRAVAADGRHGYAPLAPYDAIHVGGSCPDVPDALTSQLRPGGRLLLCVGDSDAPQCLTLVEKCLEAGGEVTLRRTVLDRGAMMYGLS